MAIIRRNISFLHGDGDDGEKSSVANKTITGKEKDEADKVVDCDVLGYLRSFGLFLQDYLK
jgi:hypothetical protein